jgi:hypothetical protein
MQREWKIRVCPFHGRALRRTMQIWVKTLTARKTALDVDESTTILDVKKELNEKEGIDVSQIRLIFQGKQTADVATLGSLGVKGGDQLHMVLALRG